MVRIKPLLTYLLTYLFNNKSKGSCTVGIIRPSHLNPHAQSCMQTHQDQSSLFTSTKLCSVYTAVEWCDLDNVGWWSAAKAHPVGIVWLQVFQISDCHCVKRPNWSCLIEFEHTTICQILCQILQTAKYYKLPNITNCQILQTAKYDYLYFRSIAGEIFKFLILAILTELPYKNYII